MTPPVTNSGRALPLPPKGINVNSNGSLRDLAERSQTSTCPEHFWQYCAPRKNLPSADGDAPKSLPTSTGREARHV